ELVNAVTKFQDENDTSSGSDQARLNLAVVHEALEIVLLALSPVVPHFCHVLWQHLGHQNPIINQPWPAVDESALVQDELQMVVQVNGKLRGKITVARESDRETLEKLALADANVQKHIEGLTVRKIIVVPEKLVNIVVG